MIISAVLETPAWERAKGTKPWEMCRKRPDVGFHFVHLSPKRPLLTWVFSTLPPFEHSPFYFLHTVRQLRPSIILAIPILRPEPDLSSLTTAILTTATIPPMKPPNFTPLREVLIT